MDFEKCDLLDNIKQKFENLSDEEKIKKAIKENGTNQLFKILTYFELFDNPLHRELALEKWQNDVEMLYIYARDIIQGRFQEAEDIIKKDPKQACSYAIYILKRRWKEAELYIKEHPDRSLYYVENLIKERWREAEHSIMQDPMSAFWYSVNFIKERWIEAEKYIKTDSQVFNLYCQHFYHEYRKDMKHDEENFGTTVHEHGRYK